MGFRNVKDGVYGQQLQYSRESGRGHGQMGHQVMKSDDR